MKNVRPKTSFEHGPANDDAFDQQPGQDNHDAIVVFVGHTECYWLKWLRPGFRHCFSAIRNDDHWIVCDPLKDRMTLIAIDFFHEFDLARFYAEQGYMVLAGPRIEQESVGFLQADLLTCVTVSKRLLGVRSFWVWTPWQLFRFLTKQRSMSGSWHPVDPRLKEKVKLLLDT